MPFPSPGDLPNPGIEPRSPALQADTLTSEPPGKVNQLLTDISSNIQLVIARIKLMRLQYNKRSKQNIRKSCQKLKILIAKKKFNLNKEEKSRLK